MRKFICYLFLITSCVNSEYRPDIEENYPDSAVGYGIFIEKKKSSIHFIVEPAATSINIILYNEGTPKENSLFEVSDEELKLFQKVVKQQLALERALGNYNSHRDGCSITFAMSSSRSFLKSHYKNVDVNLEVSNEFRQIISLLKRDNLANNFLK